MDADVLVATSHGLWQLTGDRSHAVDAFAGRAVNALAHDRASTWAIVDGNSLWQARDGSWRQRATIPGASATCLAATSAGVLVGTEHAHLLQLGEHGVTPLSTFEDVEGRQAWYSPWGAPADTRSIAVGPDAAIYVNVHVGGVVRSNDGGASWTPTLDIESDVHQVLAHPTRGGVVLVAAAAGFGLSLDGGAHWQFVTAGLHAHYLRAVAISGDDVLVSASAGFHGRRATLYRKPLVGGRFERCRAGLPQWFGDNVDTAGLAAAGALAVCGTQDGRIFRSVDGGRHWQLAVKDLPPITALTIA
jgi:hypothetical protein